LIKNHMY